MIYKAPAKINLCLDILKREENGFHLIQSVYQTVPLFDIITIEQNEKTEISFSGNEADMINKEDNTVLKAIELLNDIRKFRNNYKISVKKDIPIGAGLGGGSSDAAITIRALNDLESLRLSPEEMRDTGAKIGVDVPQFIEENTCLGVHYGEQITKLPVLENIPGWEKKYKILVIPPADKRKKTAERYADIDINLTGKNKAKTDSLIKALHNGVVDVVIENIHNDFEIFAGEEFEYTKKILEEKEGAVRALLCGSGTAVFAVSNNPFDAASLSRELPSLRILDLNR